MTIPLPTADNIVVKENPSSEVTQSGLLYLPQQHVDRGLHSGTVLAVGPGSQYPDYTRARMDLFVGDEILFGRLSGIEITYDGETYLVMNQKDVIAITKEGDDGV